MKTRFGLIALVVFAVAALAFWLLRPSEKANAAHKTIVIASVVEIQPIADLRAGFRETIDKSSLGEKVDYVEKNAQNDSALMAQIASEVAQLKPDLVYVLGTPLA